MAHAWTEREDIAALYLHKFGVEALPYSLAQIAERMGIDVGTLRMRIGNFKALSGPGGLRNWAKQSERVFKRYKDRSEPELRELAFPWLRGRE